MLTLMVLQAAATGLMLEEARAMSPRALADALLPRAGQVERAVVHPTAEEAPSLSINWVDLYSSEIEAPERGFCERRYTFVNMVPADARDSGMGGRRAVRMRAFEPRVETQLRHAGGAPCHGAETRFFPVKPETRAAQAALVGMLAAARAQARGRAALPFRLRCTDATTDAAPACDPATARRWLAALPVETTSRVVTAEPGAGGKVEVPVDDLFVDATLTVEGGRTAAIALDRRPGAAAMWGQSGRRRR